MKATSKNQKDVFLFGWKYILLQALIEALSLLYHVIRHDCKLFEPNILFYQKRREIIPEDDDFVKTIFSINDAWVTIRNIYYK